MHPIILLIILIFLISIALTSTSLAPWVPTKKKDLERIRKLANLKEGEFFYDLGCGDGRVAIYIARNSKANSVGLELAFPFYFICLLRRVFIKNKRLQFKLNNLFYEDLTKADVVYMFPANSEKLTGKIIKKLEQELKPGARVITYVFPIKSWQEVLEDKPNEKDISIFLYIR
jgi:SAM-dependent methyltransferase